MDNTEPAPAAAADENQIIAERRAKLAALRAQGNAFPNDFRRDALAADLHAQHGAKTNEELEPLAITVTVAGRMMLKRVMGKASFATIQDMSGRIQLYVTADAVGADVARRVQALGSGRPRRRDRPRVQDPHRRAFAQGDVAAPAGEGAAAAAGEVPRAVRPGAALPAALRRPHHQCGVARGLPAALADRAGGPRVLRGARLSRSRDADDAPDPRRRRGAAVRDAPQRARHAAVPAHRAGALSEEARRRRHGEGVRDQPQLPQRRHLDPAQSRVHDARVLRGLPGLPVPDGSHRDALPGGGAEGRRNDDGDLPGRRDRPREAVRPAHDGRGDPQVPPAVPAGRARASPNT